MTGSWDSDTSCTVVQWPEETWCGGGQQFGSDTAQSLCVRELSSAAMESGGVRVRTDE